MTASDAFIRAWLPRLALSCSTSPAGVTQSASVVVSGITFASGLHHIIEMPVRATSQGGPMAAFYAHTPPSPSAPSPLEREGHAYATATSERTVVLMDPVPYYLGIWGYVRAMGRGNMGSTMHMA